MVRRYSWYRFNQTREKVLGKYPGIYQRIEELEQENLNLAYQIEQIENKLK